MAENGVVTAWSSFLSADIIATAPSYDIVVNKSRGRIKGSHNITTRCCCNDICGEKATPSCYHPIFPPSNWKLDFWSFLAICACSWLTSWSQLRFYWQNYYHRVLLQWYLWRKSYSRLLPPPFPSIGLKIQFLAIFGHFSPLVPTHVWPLDPASAYRQKCFHRVLLRR